MIETFISLCGAANTLHDSYNKISGIFRPKENNSHLEYLDRIASGIERLSDNILYAPNMEAVQDITQNRQRKIDNFREVKESLEPLLPGFQTRNPLNFIYFTLFIFLNFKYGGGCKGGT